MTTPRHIFKAYDIRGIYPTELNEEVAIRVGQAFVTYLLERMPDTLEAGMVVVARDMRISGPSLARALEESLLEMGVDVVDVGMISTDMLTYAAASYGVPALMVSASHNPKEWNGFKMIARVPQFVSGEALAETFFSRRVSRARAGKGMLHRADIWDGYVEKVLSFIDPKALRPLTVVIDAANGMGGPVVQYVFRHLPQIKVIPLYLEPDGNFPNHGADPLQEENRRELIKRVMAEKADLGFAFDGDADRFFCIEDTGFFIPGDYMTALLAREFLKYHPSAAIIYDVRASWAVPEMVAAGGGKAVMNRVGHAFIKARMAEEDAIFGGEVTGHYYFKDYYYADSGIIPALLVLALISREGKRLSEIIRPLREKYFISGEINSTVKDSNAVMETLSQRYRDGELSRLDGISVTYPDWHFNVRPSNTEPLLRLNLEAKTKELMEEKRDALLRIIRGSL